MKKYRVGIFIAVFVILFDLSLWLAVKYLAVETPQSSFSSMAAFPAANTGQGMSSSLILQASPTLRID